MFKTLRQLFGISQAIDYARLVREGAIVLDVRTPEEFNKAHIAGAVNIPIEKLNKNMHRLSKAIPIIACCNDGSKSWYAKNLLDANGYRKVYDAGNWRKLERGLRI